MRHRTQGRRSRALALLAALLFAVSGLLFACSAPASAPAPTPPAPPAAVESAPTTAPTQPAPEVTGAPGASAPSSAASPTPGGTPPLHLTFPAAGVDMPVEALVPTEAELAARSLEPPLTQDAYWLANYGRPGPGSTDTTYIAGHSWIGLDAPFNRIADHAAVGQQFTVGTAAGPVAYRVTAVATYTKDTLRDAPIWAVQPGAVVLVTCYPEDPHGKNLVVTGVPA